MKIFLHSLQAVVRNPFKVMAQCCHNQREYNKENKSAGALYNSPHCCFILQLGVLQLPNRSNPIKYGFL